MGLGCSPGCRTCCSTSPCSQAFFVTFTSDFLPRMYYRYICDSSCVNFTLVHVSWDFVLQSNTMCRWETLSHLVWLCSSFAWAWICFSLPPPQRTLCLARQPLARPTALSSSELQLMPGLSLCPMCPCMGRCGRLAARPDLGLEQSSRVVVGGGSAKEQFPQRRATCSHQGPG